MSMVLAATWVRRGVAAQFPKKYQIDEAEMDRVSKLARLQLEDARDDLAEQTKNLSTKDSDAEETDEDDPGGGIEIPSKATQKTEEGLLEYNMDDYDKEEEDEDGEKFSMFGNVKSLVYHAPHEEDPYLVLPEGQQPDDEDDEEREELQILTTDNLLLAAKVEDEVAHLEVLVYEDDADNMYVHHDIMLPAVPLCVEWLDIPVGERSSGKDTGNFVAIATMRPEIEIWDLDVVDSMYPNAILGQQPDEPTKPKGKKKKKKRPKANDEYHVDAVLSLAANRQHRNLLASASADKTIKLWDLTTTTCAKSYSIHKDKVCSIDWHTAEPTILLSGGYDRAAIATDMRAPDSKAPRWTVEADVEQVRWNPHEQNQFYVTTEAGTVHAFDARQPGQPEGLSKSVWTLQAHDSAVSSFDVNPIIPGFLVTGSNDKQVKLWDVQENKPSMVASRNAGVGRVFSSRFAPDPAVSFRLAVAGSKGAVQVWDTSTNGAVRRVFGNRAAMPLGEVRERIVGMANDDSDLEDDDEDEEEPEASNGRSKHEGEMDED